MADNALNSFINAGNTAFGLIATETFEVVKGPVGVYTAISIDDLISNTAVAPGGYRGDNTVLIHISRAVLLSSSIVEGNVLLVRAKRVRVSTVTDEGDNTLLLTCVSAGVKI